MKAFVILFLLACGAKVSVSVHSTDDPSGWSSYFSTESDGHNDAVEVVDPSGWNYDRGTKNSMKSEAVNKNDRKKQVLMFCQKVVEEENVEINAIIETEVEVATKSRIAAHFNKEATVNETMAFVRRFISILLESADLSDKYLEGGPDVSGVVEIKVSTERLKTLVHFSNSIANVSMRELDSILSASIYRKHIPTFGLPELIDKIFFMASQKEVWLPVILTVIVICVFHLIMNSKTATCLFTSLVLLIFTVGYIVEYYRMYKEVEIQQKMILDRHSDIPSSCRASNHAWWSTLLKSFSVNNEEKECEKYYKALLLDPLVEVSPSRVLSNILSDFVLSPFSKAGETIAAFTAAIIGGLPVQYGWIVWLSSSGAIFLLIVLGLVLLIGGSVQFHSLFSGVSISRNRAPHAVASPTTPAVTGNTLSTSRSQPLLEAVSGMSNFVLMDADSLGTLVLRAQSSVTTHHSGVQELTNSSNDDALQSGPSSEKIDLSKLQKKRLLAVIDKEEQIRDNGCEVSNVKQETGNDSMTSETEKNTELESTAITNGKEELLCTFEVIQSDVNCSPLDTVMETDSVREVEINTFTNCGN